MTSWFSSAKATASGSPTYPSPTIPTFIGRSVGTPLAATGFPLATLAVLLSRPGGGAAVDDVVDVSTTGDGGGQRPEAGAVDGGQVADHRGRIDAEHLLEEVDIVSLNADGDRASPARHLAGRPIGPLIRPVGDGGIHPRGQVRRQPRGPDGDPGHGADVLDGELPSARRQLDRLACGLPRREIVVEGRLLAAAGAAPIDPAPRGP